MTDALARPRPRIDHPDELERLVRQIVERVDPVAVYLFGSRARGDADENSDYDLMVKGALVAHLIRPRKGHEIEEFSSLLPADFPLKERFRRLDRFSDFAWAHRYPAYPGQEPIPEPSVEDARAWLDEVRALQADFERWLGQRASS